MSKPVNKTLIGVFVLGAVTLAVTAVLIFGSGKFFAPVKKFVLFFEGSVKGLNVGAPVIFRGVKIGEVTAIQLHFDPKHLTTVIPVYVEIDPSTFTVPVEFTPLEKDVEKKYVFIQPLVEKGLKAQLQMQSFVTGQLMINLDFYPDKPIKLVGLEKKYPEIPTVPTSMEELSKTLQNLKPEELYKKVMLTVEGIEKIVNSPELLSTIRSVNQTMKSADRLVHNIDVQAGPLLANLQRSSEAARNVLAEVERALSAEKGIPAQLEETLKTTNSTLKQVENTFATIQSMTEENANIGYELNRALKELSAAARSIRILADYLERHPEALLKGKTSSEGE
jgi:paraquat-inducible protein B